MKILIDTNILISAALFPDSIPAQAYQKAVTYPYQGLVCEQNIVELHRIFNRKFPTKLSALEHFLTISAAALDIIPIPIEENPCEQRIRDTKDRTILRAAISANADFLLTGDKDFLEAKIPHPKIITAADFLRL